MLTGLYTHQHGITGNDPAGGQDREIWLDRFFENPMLPKLLADAGYNTMHTGKYWMRQPAAAGFTHDNGETGRHGGSSLNIGRSTMKPIYDFMDESIKNKKPFFVWYAPFLPHTPHNPPKRLLDKYADVEPESKAKYYAMVEWLDETCGDLMKNLKERGVDDNTLVLYLADNGWNKFGKASPYENGIRTPIIARWPAKIKPHREEHTLASNIDIVPTILAACEVSIPKTMPGINLLDAKAVAGRTELFFNNFSHNMISAREPEKSLWTRSVIQEKWKLITYQDPLPKAKPNAGGHKRKVRGQNQELYDLLADPHEAKELSKDHPDVVKKLQASMDAWWNPNVVHNKPEAAKDPDVLVQVEYLGEGTLPDGTKSKVGAQVITQKKGQFDVMLYAGGLPGGTWTRTGKKFRLRAKTEGDRTMITGVKITGEIKGDAMTITGEKANMTLKKTVRKIRLFILSGQSNMGGLRPDVSFTPAVKAAYPDDEVIVAWSAKGGQAIRLWYKKWELPEGSNPKVGDLNHPIGGQYPSLMKPVNLALKGRTPDTIAFAWMQGERDAKLGWQAAYEESLNGLIKQIRDDLKHPKMVVSIGRLSDHLKNNESWDAVRAAQMKVAKDDTLVGWVGTDDLNNIHSAKAGRIIDDLHYTKDGYKILGERFAEQLIALLKANEK
jgi:uncharacterized sulfatase